MNIPGANLLGIAMSVLTPTSNLFIRHYVSEGDNEFGNSVVTYTNPEPLMGASAQPISTRDVQQMGLTVGRRYLRVWCQGWAEAGGRGRENDQFIWDLELWTIIEPEFWVKQDGWTVVVAVWEGAA